MIKNRDTGILSLALACALLPCVGTSAPRGFDLAEDKQPQVVELAPQTLDWTQARLLPAALALAASDARRGAAASHSSHDDLNPGPDGAVDLALSTVIDLTLRNNRDLLVRSYDPAVAAETLKAREALFDPLLRFTLSLFSSTNPTSGSLAGAAVLSRKEQQGNIEVLEQLPWGGQGTFTFNNTRGSSNNVFNTLDPSYNSVLNFSVSQPLLRDFGKDVTRREIRIARNDRASSKEGFRNQVMTTVATAIDAYWDLVGKRETLRVQREGLKLAAELLRINRTRVEVGTMAPLDVSLAEAEEARSKGQVIIAEADVRNGEDRVRQLIGLPVKSRAWAAELRPIDSPAVENKPLDVDQAIATAFENRPELKQQDFQSANSQIRLDYAHNQLKPGLQLQASYGFTGLGGTQILRSGGLGDTSGTVTTIPGGYGDAFSQLTRFGFDTWRLAAVLELPVFNQLARANHAAAILNHRRDEDTLEATRQSVAVEVRQRARAVRTNFERIEANGATRGYQERRLDAERKKFEHGLSTNFEVQQAQKDVTDARTAEALAVTDYRRSLTALERAMGTLLQANDLHILE